MGDAGPIQTQLTVLLQSVCEPVAVVKAEDGEPLWTSPRFHDAPWGAALAALPRLLREAVMGHPEARTLLRAVHEGVTPPHMPLPLVLHVAWAHWQGRLHLSPLLWGDVPAVAVVLRNDKLHSDDARATAVRKLLPDATNPLLTGDISTGLRTAAGVAPAPVAPRALRILLVEDVQMSQLLALEALHSFGHRAEAVDSGQQALDVLKRRDFDLVFMDCQMPGMDGYTTARLIRIPGSGVRNPLVPIIAMGGNALGGDKDKYQDAGMNDYITKPFQLEELERVVKRWVSVNPLVAALRRPEG